MKQYSVIVSLLFLTYSLMGCKSSGNSDASDARTDASISGHLDLSTKTSDLLVPDFALGENFGLYIPTEIELCMRGPAIGNVLQAEDILDDFLDDYQNAGRVTLKAGLIRLPRDKPSFEAQWIKKVEIGPQGTVAEPSPGIFSRSLDGNEKNGIYHFRFHQTFTLESTPYTLSFTIDFVMKDGMALAPLYTLDDSFTSNYLQFTMELSTGSENTLYAPTRRYGSCKLTPYQQEIFIAATEKKEQIELTMHMKAYDPEVHCTDGGCYAAGGTQYYGTLTRASIKTQNGASRIVEDRTKLLYWGHPHLFTQVFLIAFEPTFEGHRGMVVFKNGVNDKVLYLDDQWKPIDLSKITEFTWVGH